MKTKAATGNLKRVVSKFQWAAFSTINWKSPITAIAKTRYWLMMWLSEEDNVYVCGMWEGNKLSKNHSAQFG
ncbi:hypothetical protein [Sphingobacterium sp. DR205]|uniref:hypothetical protein n=1 Tax=Sphingobacterium sp. DR205 TaxID=2713573 RepID=UPI0013E437EB|nr:hypothetical protein [Sphingobacterium sp. DR205]QIH34896.1 hypothetical protein G6053_19225 [Sphingobacterium sp. DR205]